MDNVENDIMTYFSRRYIELGIRIVSGHHLNFKTKQEVDKYIEGLQDISDFMTFAKERDEKKK